jgi:hypothetical protein
MFYAVRESVILFFSGTSSDLDLKLGGLVVQVGSKLITKQQHPANLLLKR